MINPLRIGNQIYPVNLIQGPLAGISCSPFRRLAWQYSQPAFCYTEMISCKTIISQHKSNKRLTHIDPHEGPVCFQLTAKHLQELGEAVKIVTQLGANLIDLNCGCPVNKIRSRGEGSAHLMKPDKLYRLLIAMKQNTHLPVSIKIRVQGSSTDQFHSDIIKVVKDTGVDFITVHGRHWTEHYETPCNYNDIQFFVNELNIPVIGNGDVACVESLKKMLATGCAGVMIGRAGVGKPWLIRKLIAEIKQEQFKMPSAAEIGDMLIEHVKRLIMISESEKQAILQARKFAKYYARGVVSGEICAEINTADTLDEINKLAQKYFNE